MNRRRGFGICIPGYRWCGPGCSGPGAPTNAVDNCCMHHDQCYRRFGATRRCDQAFQDCLRSKINPNTRHGRDAAFFSNVNRLKNSIWF